jgi:hypothetical protein
MPGVGVRVATICNSGKDTGGRGAEWIVPFKFRGILLKEPDLLQILRFKSHSG